MGECVALDEGRITTGYLPVEHWGAVETRILRRAPSLVGRILEPNEIEDLLSLRLCAAPIDHCIRNLTHRFRDGPTWYAITDAPYANAVVARFENFQCIVVSQAFHVTASLLFVRLLAWPPLREFVRNGAEPPEPTSPPSRGRVEAVVQLLADDGEFDGEARELTAAFCYLLLYLLTAHEIGHLALGHLDLCDNGQMVEVDSNPAEKAQSRAMEWDADGFAIAATQWLAGSEFREVGSWPQLLSDNSANLRVVCTTAYVLFTLMDALSPQDRPTETRTHPRPLVRAGLAAHTLTRLVHVWGAVDGSEVISTMRQVSRSIEFAILETAGGVMEAPLANELGIALGVEIDSLGPIYNALIPQLDRSRLDGVFWAKALQSVYPLAAGSDGLER